MLSERSRPMHPGAKNKPSHPSREVQGPHVEHLRQSWLALTPPVDTLPPPSRSLMQLCLRAAATRGAWLARTPSSPALNCMITVPLLQEGRGRRVGTGANRQQVDYPQAH